MREWDANYKVFFSYRLFQDGKSKEESAGNLHVAIERVGKMLRNKDTQIDIGHENIQFDIPNTNEVWARITWQED